MTDSRSALAERARKELESGGGSVDDTPWHRWVDSNEVIGTFVGMDTFTNKEGEQQEFVVLDTSEGKRKVGMGYAVLRSAWQDKAPMVGDDVCVMRGVEKRVSQTGREYWPFVVAVERAEGQQAISTAAPEPVSHKTTDPDDEIPF